MRLKIIICYLMIISQMAQADNKGVFESAKPVTFKDAASLIGTYLGQCETEFGTETDVLFWGYFISSSGESMMLPIPASLTSKKDIIQRDLYNLKNWYEIAESIRLENDRNGNPWMYQFESNRSGAFFGIDGNYMHGINSCERNLAPGNPDRIVCDPPILPADQGYGLLPMTQLKVIYRINAEGLIISKQSYQQNNNQVNKYCRWSKRIADINNIPPNFRKPRSIF